MRAATVLSVVMFFSLCAVEKSSGCNAATTHDRHCVEVHWCKQAGAHSSGVERVPLTAEVASPAVFFAGRPTTKRASYARAGRVNALVLIEVAIQD